MRIVFISTYWPEYSGPALRVRRLNKMFDKNILIITSKRREKGFAIRKNKLNNHFEYIFEYNTFYILDFLISFILCLFIPYKSQIHALGSCAQVHATFLVTYIRRDLKLVIELVNGNSAPLINFSKVNIKLLPRLKSTLVLALNSGQKTGKYKKIIKPNPISQKFLDFKPRFTVRKYPINEDSMNVNIGYLSKFKYRKNQLFLINVMQYLPENYNLILSGPTDELLDENLLSNKIYIESIYKLICKLNLWKRIKIYEGFQDPIEFFKLIDHYAIPSFNEGFGTTIVEAIACGIPVTFNKDEQAFLDCYSICKKTLNPSQINNPKRFAKDIVNLNRKVTNLDLFESRKNVLSLCVEENINKIYKSIF